MIPVIHESHNFKGAAPGKSVLVLGGIHGNEVCGTIAIRRFLQDLADGKVTIARGQVTFLPCVNVEAQDKDVRYIDQNLNRLLRPVPNPVTYEESLMSDLCHHLEQCDVLLDLHSAHTPTAPHTFVDPKDRPEETEYARIIGADYALTSWRSMYLKLTGYDPNTSIGTTEYARGFGATVMTLECGSHKDPVAIEFAYQAITRALAYFGLIDAPAPTPKDIPFIQMHTVFYKEREGSMVRDFGNFEPVQAGEIIARYDDGETLCAPVDGCMVLPRPHAIIGDEWFYIGVPSGRLPS